jgi:hypothetical protein
MSTKTLEAPSNAQIGFVNTLLKERKHNLSDSFIAEHLMTKKGASELIGELKACEKVSTGSGVEIAPGFYVAPDETVYEVCKSARGFTYAKRLVVPEPVGCRGHYDNLDGSYFECGIPFQTTEQQKNKEWDNLPIRDYGCREHRKGKAKFTYDPGAIKGCADWTLLSVEVAGSLGRKFGFCVICGRVLSNPESVARGIGPICGGRL